MEHTELPWKSKTDVVFVGDYGTGIRIAVCLYTNEDKQDEANADFIVKACNSHASLTKQRDGLLAACEDHKKMTVENLGNTVWSASYKKMEAAIASAS